MMDIEVRLPARNVGRRYHLRSGRHRLRENRSVFGETHEADFQEWRDQHDFTAHRLMQHAHAFEVMQDGRIYIEKLNGPFLYVDKGTPEEYAAGSLARSRSAGPSCMTAGRLCSSRLPVRTYSPEG